MSLLKIIKSRQNKNFLPSNKIKGWKVLLIVLITLIASGLIVARFFNNGSYWLTVDDLNPEYGLDYEGQVLYGAACLIAGFGIPIVGTSMQVITRNKLAEPTTLGFYPVIFMGTLLSQLTLDNNVTSYLISMSLSVGVVLVNFIILKGKPGKSSFKAILIGFAINAMATGANYLIITYSSAKGNPLSWISGDFSNITEQRVIISSILVIIFSLVLIFLIPYFNVIQKDYTLAKALGINVDLIYWIVAFCSIVITVSSMLIIGGVVLLGIVVPHLTRMIFRTEDNKIIIPMSGILGMFLLSMSQWIVDAIVGSYGITLNINILVAILAIPIFILILKGKKKNV